MNKNILNDGIPLGEAIKMIRDELIRSQEERENEGKLPLFEVERLTIEANCIFVRKEDSSMGVDVKVLSLFSAKGNISEMTENSFVQKIKLELKVCDEGKMQPGIYPHDSLR